MLLINQQSLSNNTKQTSENNLTGKPYSSKTRQLNFYGFWFRYQEFDNCLEEEPRVGTPIGQSLRQSVFFEVCKLLWLKIFEIKNEHRNLNLSYTDLS